MTFTERYSSKINFIGSFGVLSALILQYSRLEEMMDILEHMEIDIRVIVE